MVLDPARLHSALDAIADLFASCDSPDAEILAAEQIQLFTALCRTGAVVSPEDLPAALRALWQQAPEVAFPDPDEPDVFDVPDPVPGSLRRGRIYLAVDNTTGSDRSSADQGASGGQAPAVGDSGPPPTGAP